MARKLEPQRVEMMKPEDRERVDMLLRDIGGPNVGWGSIDILNVWLAEKRMEAELLASRRVERATRALVGATVALVVATAGLIVATLVG